MPVTVGVGNNLWFGADSGGGSKGDGAPAGVDWGTFRKIIFYPPGGDDPFLKVLG